MAVAVPCHAMQEALGSPRRREGLAPNAAGLRMLPAAAKTEISSPRGYPMSLPLPTRQVSAKLNPENGLRAPGTAAGAPFLGMIPQSMPHLRHEASPSSPRRASNPPAAPVTPRRTTFVVQTAHQLREGRVTPPGSPLRQPRILQARVVRGASPEASVSPTFQVNCDVPAPQFLLLEGHSPKEPARTPSNGRCPPVRLRGVSPVSPLAGRATPPAQPLVSRSISLGGAKSATVQVPAQKQTSTMVFASLMQAAEDLKSEILAAIEGADAPLPPARSSSQGLGARNRSLSIGTTTASDNPVKESPVGGSSHSNAGVNRENRVPSSSAGPAKSRSSPVDSPLGRLGPPIISASSPENQAMLNKIMAYLKHPSKLKSVVWQILEEVDVAGRGLDLEGLVKFRHRISIALGILELNFGEASRQHHRFDFDGTGLIQEPALQLLVRMQLFEHCKKLGDYTSGIIVPRKTLSETGFQMMDVIARGNQSTANLANDAAGCLYCIKTYDKSKMSTVDVDSLRDEFEVSRCLGKHPNIAAALDIFQDEEFYYMVQELNQGGDFTTLKQRAAEKGVHTGNNWWRGVFRQCFEGLSYLHDNALMHCDVKEPNLMLKTERHDHPEVVIIDLGYVQSCISDWTTIAGTPGYIPPETWNTGRFYPRGDMFAMGVVIMQMLLDKMPPHHNPPQCEVLPGGIFTEGVTLIKAVGTITRTRTPPFNLMAADWPVLTQLTRRLLAKDMLRRPCSRQVLQDVWMSSEITDDAHMPVMVRGSGPG